MIKKNDLKNGGINAIESESVFIKVLQHLKFTSFAFFQGSSASLQGLNFKQQVFCKLVGKDISCHCIITLLNANKLNLN